MQKSQGAIVRDHSPTLTITRINCTAASCKSQKKARFRLHYSVMLKVLFDAVGRRLNNSPPKMSTPPQSVNTLPNVVQRTVDMINLGSCDREIILDYRGVRV